MNMISTKLTATEKAEANKAFDPCKPSDREYPYGLTVCLNYEMLQKLGITELPPIGTKFMLHAMVEVYSTSATEDKQDGKEEIRKTVDMQIEEMGLDAVGTDPAAQAKSMYPTMIGSV